MIFFKSKDKIKCFHCGKKLENYPLCFDEIYIDKIKKEKFCTISCGFEYNKTLPEEIQQLNKFKCDNCKHEFETDKDKNPILVSEDYWHEKKKLKCYCTKCFNYTKELIEFCKQYNLEEFSELNSFIDKTILPITNINFEEQKLQKKFNLIQYYVNKIELKKPNIIDSKIIIRSLNKKEREELFKKYKEILIQTKKEPENIKNYLLQGEYLFKLAEGKIAIQNFNIYIKNDFNSIYEDYLITALEIYSKILEIEDIPLAIRMRGHILVCLGEFEHAKKDYRISEIYLTLSKFLKIYPELAK